MVASAEPIAIGAVQYPGACPGVLLAHATVSGTTLCLALFVT